MTARRSCRDWGSAAGSWSLDDKALAGHIAAQLAQATGSYVYQEGGPPITSDDRTAGNRPR